MPNVLSCEWVYHSSVYVALVFHSCQCVVPENVVLTILATLLLLLLLLFLSLSLTFRSSEKYQAPRSGITLDTLLY